MKKINYIKLAKQSAKKQISELRKISKVFNNSFIKAVETIYQCKGKVICAGVGKSGLIAACGSEHKHVVSFLLKQPSIDISQTDKHGWNALHWATQFSKKSAEIVIALLNHSTTNINVINQQEKTYGFTPLDKAYRRLSKLQQTRNRTKQDNEEQVIYHIINAILLKGGVSIMHH